MPQRVKLVVLLVLARPPRFASVPVLTFVSYRGGLAYECQNQRDTSKSMILVKL
jgi:hypothetical protein